MTFLPITLGVGYSSDAEKGRNRIPSKSDSEKTLTQDDHACRFCGFRSLRYQRVVSYAGGKTAQFVTACTFCDQCIHLERAGITGAGLLIWLPEIGQAQLNHIIRAIYLAQDSETDMAESATRGLEVLTTRRAEAKKRLGSDDPLLLATVMQEMLTQKENAAAAPKIEGIRLLPSDKHVARGLAGDANQFPNMLKYWRSPEGPYARLPLEEWREMFKTAVSKVGHA